MDEPVIYPCCVHCGPPTHGADPETVQYGSGLGHQRPCPDCQTGDDDA